MVLNFNNLFGSESKNTKLSDFQDLDQITVKYPMYQLMMKYMEKLYGLKLFDAVPL